MGSYLSPTALENFNIPKRLCSTFKHLILVNMYTENTDNCILLYHKHAFPIQSCI